LGPEEEIHIPVVRMNSGMEDGGGIYSRADQNADELVETRAGKDLAVLAVRKDLAAVHVAADPRQQTKQVRECRVVLGCWSYRQGPER
jgi:hypothetical protein